MLPFAPARSPCRPGLACPLPPLFSPLLASCRKASSHMACARTWLAHRVAASYERKRLHAQSVQVLHAFLLSLSVYSSLCLDEFISVFKPLRPFACARAGVCAGRGLRGRHECQNMLSLACPVSWRQALSCSTPCSFLSFLHTVVCPSVSHRAMCAPFALFARLLRTREEIVRTEARWREGRWRGAGGQGHLFAAALRTMVHVSLGSLGSLAYYVSSVGASNHYD